jgi:Domain of unknown function (DUF4258)
VGQRTPNIFGEIYFTIMENLQRFSEWLGRTFENWDIQYRIHATQRMFLRNIQENEIVYVLLHGHIIENYENDFPFPSVLVSGITASQRQLHIVIAVDKKLNRFYVITTYEPHPQKWIENFTRRKVT